jgi:hypothetical protein
VLVDPFALRLEFGGFVGAAAAAATQGASKLVPSKGVLLECGSMLRIARPWWHTQEATANSATVFTKPRTKGSRRNNFTFWREGRWSIMTRFLLAAHAQNRVPSGCGSPGPLARGERRCVPGGGT